MTSVCTVHRKWSVALLLLAIMTAVIVGMLYQNTATTTSVASPPSPSTTPPIISAPPTPSFAASTPSASKVTSAAAIPSKAEPTRLTIPAAAIDTPVSHLPMSPEEITERSYTPPQTPEGYYVRFTENEITPFDFPGNNTSGATWIMGHSCDGLIVCQESDWQFNRLSDPRLVRIDTAITITTMVGKVCYRTIAVQQVGAHDVASQNLILNEAVKQHYLILTTCYPEDIHGQNTFVIAAMESCI